MSRGEFIADSLKIIKPKFVRPQFKIDNRITLFNHQQLSVTGVDAGILIKERLRITLGFYTTSNRLTTIKKTVNNVDYLGHYTINYGAINAEFQYINKPHYSFGFPIELGLGGNKLNYQSTLDNTQTPKEKSFISVLYFGLSATYKPVRWLGIKGAGGYKKTLLNKIKDTPFDGFYYSIGLIADFREVAIDYRLYKLKKKYRKKANSVETAVDLITH
ncbi:MAG: hypothetical protein ABI388_01835 [Bacteroidia bacterium]